MLGCCRSGHSILKRILSLWYSKEPVLYQYIDGNTTILHSVSLDRTIRRYKLWNMPYDARVLSHLDATTIIESKPDAPWLWIGASSWSGTVDMTTLLQPYVVSGNKITWDVLQDLYPTYYDWRYLDPVTFKEVNFPTDGITIDAARLESIAEADKKDTDS